MSASTISIRAPAAQQLGHVIPDTRRAFVPVTELLE
jgi:hypothetical protein